MRCDSQVLLHFVERGVFFVSEAKVDFYLSSFF